MNAVVGRVSIHTCLYDVHLCIACAVSSAYVKEPTLKSMQRFTLSLQHVSNRPRSLPVCLINLLGSSDGVSKSSEALVRGVR